MCDPKNIPKDVEIKGKFSTSLRNIDYNDKNQFAHSTNNSQFTFNAKNSQGLYELTNNNPNIVDNSEHNLKKLNSNKEINQLQALRNIQDDDQLLSQSSTQKINDDNNKSNFKS